MRIYASPLVIHFELLLHPATCKRYMSKRSSPPASSNTNGTSTSEPSNKKLAMSASASTSTPLPVTSFLVQRLSEKARLPTRGSALAAGYDLYSAEAKTVPARGKALINTQLSIAVPEGTYGRIAPRSGLASKFMIDCGAGVIDADYRGTVHVLLFNLSDKDFEVNEGDRVAQLILERIVTPEVTEVESLSETVRGAGGFGSTGGFSAPAPAAAVAADAPAVSQLD